MASKNENDEETGNGGKLEPQVTSGAMIIKPTSRSNMNVGSHQAPSKMIDVEDGVTPAATIMPKQHHQ